MNYKVLIIIGLAIVLYLFRLGTVPAGIYADEATLGVNARLLFLTGRDEYGEILPVLFRFFGSYAPGLAVYLVSSIVGIFGLNEITVRLPSVIYMAISLLAVYGILKMYVVKKLVLAGMTFFAILPWTMFYARVGYEVTLGFMLMVLGVYFVLRSKVDNRLLNWGYLCWGLSAYAAHVNRYLLPFLLLWGWFVLGRKAWKVKAVAILIVSQLLNIWLAVFHPGFWIKQSGLSDNFLVIMERFWMQLLTYLSPLTIFQKSPDIDLQHIIPGVSLAYWWMVLPFLVGLLKIKRDVLFLLILSIIPASFSGEFVSTQRALPMLLPLGVILARGMEVFKYRLFLGILLVYSLLLLWRSYFVLLPTINARAWDYGLKQVAEFVKSNNNTEVLFDMKNPRVYMPIWFYAGKTENLRFGSIVWADDPCKHQYIIGDETSVSVLQVKEHKLVEVGEVLDPTGRMIYAFFRTQPELKCVK